MPVKLKYARTKSGRMVSIDDKEVRSREGQVYLCPDFFCESKVIPRDGGSNQAHFAHSGAKHHCYGLETSLHLFAKEVFLTLDTITLPSFPVYPHEYKKYYPAEIAELEKSLNFELPSELYTNWSFNSLFDIFSTINLSNEQQVHLKEYDLEIETYQGKIKPDLRLISKEHPERQLIIEVAVTHKADTKKKEYVKNNNLALLEIDLSDVYKKKKKFTRDDVLSIFKENTLKSVWLNISRKKELLEQKKPVVLEELQALLEHISRFYKKICGKYFNGNIERMGDNIVFINDLRADLSRSDLNEKGHRFLGNDLLMNFLLSKYKSTSVYQNKLQEIQQKEKELQEWRKDFWKDYPYKKL